MNKLGKILGWIVNAYLGLAIFVSVTSIAIPEPPNGRTHILVRETAAIAAIQSINRAQVQYYPDYARYATSLDELGLPSIGAATRSYQFTLVARPGGYTINANPIRYGLDGKRTFFSDQSMVIRENHGASRRRRKARSCGSHGKRFAHSPTCGMMLVAGTGTAIPGPGTTLTAGPYGSKRSTP